MPLSGGSTHSLECCRLVMSLEIEVLKFSFVLFFFFPNIVLAVLGPSHFRILESACQYLQKMQLGF